MTYRFDPDDVIATWAAESTGGGPDYLPEVLLMVERTPQHRWARWVPGAGTSSPAKAPAISTRAVLAVAAMLLLLLVASALVAGALRRPSFTLQGVTPVPGATSTMFVGVTDDAIWTTVTDGVVAIDPSTGVTTRYEVPDGGAELNGVVATSDTVWVADWRHDRVVRLDRKTGKVTDVTRVTTPLGLGLQDGVWAIERGDRQGEIGDVVRIDPATAVIDRRLQHATSYAVVPGALWYVTRSAFGPAATEAFAVEVDPATGVERRRVAIPVKAARSIAIDAAGNPWVYQRQTDRTTIVALDAANGTAGTPFVVPYDTIGGITAVGSSMWAVHGPGSADGGQVVELHAAGPTGRVEPLDPGLDPDGAIVAFGSIWIPWDSHAVLYRYPADALSR